MHTQTQAYNTIKLHTSTNTHTDTQHQIHTFKHVHLHAYNYTHAYPCVLIFSVLKTLKLTLVYMLVLAHTSV